MTNLTNASPLIVIPLIYSLMISGNSEGLVFSIFQTFSANNSNENLLETLSKHLYFLVCNKL